MFCYTFPFPSTDEYKTKKLVLRKVPAGTYQIGHDKLKNGQAGNSSAGVYYTLKNSAHTVTVPKGTYYYMGVFELTQAQYSRVIGSKNDSIAPLHSVSWNTMRGSAGAGATLTPDKNNTTSFLIRLSGLTGKNFDLPTEEMWEIAARAGVTTYYYWGDTFSDAYCWYIGSASNSTIREVGLKSPNAWGLYDVAGSEGEVCLDVYSNADLAAKTTDIYTPCTSGTDATYRISRGGDRGNAATDMSPSARRGTGAIVSSGYTYMGYRIATIVR